MNNKHPLIGGEHFEGEKCMVCRDKTSHKVGEHTYEGHPMFKMHEFTSYLCCTHFIEIMGPAAERLCNNVSSWAAAS